MPALVTPRRRKSPLVKKLEAEAPAIRLQFGVKKIGIFGSFARGEQTKKSDVDVLVDFAEGYATLRNFVGLAERLEALFRRNVDLITVEGIDKYIRQRVEAEVIWVEG
jgi:predicted nucleotidyltransferase